MGEALAENQGVQHRVAAARTLIVIGPAPAAEGKHQPLIPAQLRVPLSIGAARIVEHGHVINGAIDGARLHPHDEGHCFPLIGGRGDHVDRIGLRYIGDWFEDAFS